MPDLLRTGIEGLDNLLSGGLRSGTCAVVEGQPGTGKTTIGLQFVHAGCITGEPGVVVTFEQFPEQIYADVEGFGWDLRELEAQGLLRVICTSPEVFVDQLSDAHGMIDELIREMGARRILVDSVSHISQMTEGPQDFRNIVYGMFNGLKRAGLTAIVTKEARHDAPRGTSFEEYMADTVIQLSFDMGNDNYRRRYIEVMKSRGQNHAYGKHTLKLGSGGAIVYPRIVERPHAAKIVDDLLSTGISGLDEMLGGGIRRGRNVLAAGSAGVGKTTLGLSFISEGCMAGEPGVYVSFEEEGDALCHMADGFGMGLSTKRADGIVSMMHFPPVHLRTDELIAELEAEVVRLGAKRVVIDSITDLAMAGQDAHRLRETVYIIGSMLKQHGVTGLLVSEVPELFGQTYVTSEHISIIVDGIILMKYVEMESEIQRAISILKMRGSGHVKDIRQFAVEDTGIRVQSRFEGTEGVMAGRARPVRIALSVRSFSEIDEAHNQDILARFTQAHPRVDPISLSLPYNPDEARETVKAAIQADVSELSVAPLCAYWMPEIFEMNRLLPLDDLVTRKIQEQHLPALLDMGMNTGRLYAIPALAACGVLLYRKDLLEEFGFSGPPKTWDELREQARTIVSGRQEEGLIGYQFPAYLYEGLATSFLQNLWSNGGDVAVDGTVSLEETPTLEALTYMRGLIHEDGLVPANMVSAAHGLEPQRNFVEGRTVFLTMLPSVAQAAQRLNSPVRGKIGIAPPPMGPHGQESITYLSGWLYGVPVGARSPQTAMEFIKFMTDAQMQKERALRGGPLPTIESLYSDPEVLAFNPDYSKILGMLRTTKLRRSIPHYPAVSRSMQEELHAMLKGNIGAAECLERMKARISAILGSA